MIQHAAPSLRDCQTFEPGKLLQLIHTDVGLHMNFVSSLVIPGEAMTSSVLHPLRNCEYGLFKECLWFLEASNKVLEGYLGGGGNLYLSWRNAR